MWRRESPLQKSAALELVIHSVVIILSEFDRMTTSIDPVQLAYVGYATVSGDQLDVLNMLNGEIS